MGPRCPQMVPNQYQMLQAAADTAGHRYKPISRGATWPPDRTLPKIFAASTADLPQGMEAPKAIETPWGPGMVIETLHTSQPATPYVLLQLVFSGQKGVLPLLGGMLHPTNWPGPRLPSPFPAQPGGCHHESSFLAISTARS